MTRAKAAVDAQKIDVAIKLLDAVIKLRPDYIEAWNRRATLYYMQNDYGRSLADIQQVLMREPRHFGALAGLGMIMQEIGDEKRALDAYRKALAINPHLDKVPEQVKALTEKSRVATSSRQIEPFSSDCGARALTTIPGCASSGLLLLTPRAYVHGGSKSHESFHLGRCVAAGVRHGRSGRRFVLGGR